MFGRKCSNSGNLEPLIDHAFRCSISRHPILFVGVVPYVVKIIRTFLLLPLENKIVIKPYMARSGSWHAMIFEFL